MNGTRRSPERGLLLVAGVGFLASLITLWTLSRPLPDIEQERRHFAELQRQVTAARASQASRAIDRGRAMRLRAQARAAGGAQRAAFEAEASALDARFGWGDRATVRATVLASPLVSLRPASVPSDVVPVFSATRSTCAACHVAIASAGFENYPAPFRTHPRMATYVGASSPHPTSRVECVSCHRGDPHATTFEAAGHSRLPGKPEEPLTRARAWMEASATDAMLPVGRTEGACVSCHIGEVFQPGAPVLNDAFVSLERAGCYACHDVPGLEDAPKRGPDLRRLRGKLSREWVRQWLADPRALKPATWMPRLWAGAGVLETGERAEIDAVVAYLFAAADDYSPELAAPPHGDVTRGEQLVASVGCLGCHVVGAAERDTTSLRRSFGQPLQAIAGKASYAWLVDWVRDPSRYSPGTRMPGLRLNTADAADVATYLETLSGPVTFSAAAPLTDDGAYREVLDRYRGSSPPGAGSTSALTGEPLRVAAGKAVIASLGCFNCHEIRGFEGQATRVTFGPRKVWLDEAASSIHAVPPTMARSGGASTTAGPSFGRAESARLALALTAMTARTRESHGITTPWQLTNVRGRRLVQERNCVGCHSVEGVGGDFAALVAEPTLAPPLLTPEGTRVQAAWLRGFLHQPTTIRPWLSVRMPTFAWSDTEQDRLLGYFEAIAPRNPPAAAAPAGANAAAGHGLFTLLKCQQCHVLGAIPQDQPTSNLAPDLRLAPERLQPESILAWLRNPSAILPGTRMPSFWPDYPKSFYDPLGRDGAAQVRAIREHLLSLRSRSQK